MSRITIPARFCGPPGTGNGGYCAGRLAAFVDAPVVEVTLRQPVPLETELEVTNAASGSRSPAQLLQADGSVVAEARALDPATFEVVVPPPVSPAEALAAARDAPMLADPGAHPFPSCFVCGPGRSADDGLNLFPGRVRGRALCAVRLQPRADELGPEFRWAALDCPSSYPMYFAEDPFEGPCVLGRIAARVGEVSLEAGRDYAVMAWREGVDGRKLSTASAIVDEHGSVCAVARATWIRIRTAS